MKKRIFAALVCLALVCSFAACDMEFGGLVGELLGDLNLPTDIEGRPLPDEILSDWAESGTMPAETWWDEETVYDETVAPNDRPDFQYSYRLYENQTLTVLGQNTIDLGLDEFSENALESSSYQRNQRMEKVFGIHVETLMAESGELEALVKNDVVSGTRDFDVVMGDMADTGASLAQSSVLLNLYDLPYLDLSTTSWDASVNEGLAIGNYLPMATGVVTPTAYLHTSLILNNKPIADNCGIDVYDYVRTGGWTIDKMNAMAELCYTDLNGDARIDQEDVLGLVATYDCANAFAVATDTMLIAKDADNMPVLNTDGMDRLAAAYESVYNLLFANGVLYFSSMQDAPGSGAAKSVFEQGNTMFYATTVQDAMQVNDMNVQMGILPFPKLNEEQESYRSYVNCSSTAVMVPIDVDKDFVGYVLEALVYATDDAYTITVSNRLVRSEQDQEMLDLVLEGKTLDFGSNYLLTATGGTVQCFKIALEQKNPTIMSLYKQYQKVLSKYLEQMVDSIPS